MRLGFLVAALIAGTSLAHAQPLTPRLILTLDTSGSMVREIDPTATFGGDWSFGDGVLDNCSASAPFCGAGNECTAGLDMDGDGLPNDSRVWIAKNAITDLVAAFGDVDWALARFAQNQGNNILCSGSYEDPACAAPDPCLNYQAPGVFNGGLGFYTGCGGADILVGFSNLAPFSGDSNFNAILRWTNQTETDFVNSTTTGSWCMTGSTLHDCEIRAHGPTPIANTLADIGTWMGPQKLADPRTCRPYDVVLISDGGESCGGDPVTEAGNLWTTYGIRTYVIGLAIDAGAAVQLNAIAAAGQTDAGAAGGDNAFFADDPDELSAGLADVVRRSLLFETCDNTDEDCDSLIDEGFTKYCNRPAGTTSLTLCVEPAETLCDGMDDDCDGIIDEGVTDLCGGCAFPAEICDGLDNNCNGVIDEGGVCGGCVPSAEICNGIDDDCDMATDEMLTRPCGTDVGECTTGIETCSAGAWGACSGQGPVPETCNNLDDDCDGVIDGLTRPCGPSEGVCVPGTETCTAGVWGPMCVGGVGPSPEICDGLDNNCNSSTDEGNPGGGGSCGTGIGACSPGTLQCTGGSLVCTGGTGPTAETCNNIDDDCDTNTDESVPTAGPCGSGVGECREGVSTCVMGSFTCVGGRGPVTELCDNRDNDCDASTDEMNPGGGVACGTDTGICELGTTQCMGGSLTCVGGVAGEMEVCDLLDNDCDGLTDEGNPGGGAACGATDVGDCELGAEACVGGMIVCVGETGPGMEICDGRDNDCDGNIDEGDPEGGAACGDDTGECSPGMTRCVAGELVCEGGVGPTEEICDGLDNDCDGVEDEGLGVGAPCGSDVGECVPGVNVCRDGMLVCEGETGPAPETCDALDNDCDAVIDESLPLGEACGTTEGVCMEGSLACIDGVEVCVGEVPPAREGCDCEDNDCDGAIDEDPDTGSLCPEGSTCVECACSLPCMMTGEFGFSCPSGKIPFETGGECFCVTPRCEDATCAMETVTRDDDTLCSPDEDTPDCTCRNNACTFPCDGVVCSDGTVCRPDSGRCVEDSCRGLGCPDGEVCDVDTGACVEDPCATVSCGAGEACRDGVCEGSCATVECAEGQVCRGGTCLDDVCDGVMCTTAEVCNPDDGSCVDDECIGVRCPAEAICDPITGECEQDPCDRLVCPDGQVCVEGECAEEMSTMDAGVDAGVDASTGDVDAGPSGRVEDRVLAAGGGGCACAVPGTTPNGPTPWALLVGVFGLVAWRRRGSRVVRRLVAIVGLGSIAAFGGGCDVDPFCLGCVEDAAVADAPSDVMVGDVGRRDVGVIDAGTDTAEDTGGDTCLPEEACNGMDDDCDGEVDEGIDVNEDPNNCGECGNVCNFAQAFPTCIDGECGLGSCDVGWFDLNGELDDGCEYRCLPSAEDDALCDLRDNDCDGEVDEDVTFDTDPVNCGACGRICRFAHVTNPRCDMGTCTFEDSDCETDFYDINGVPDDGCEYACTPADPAVEVCNNRDDDCDGMVDEGDPGGGASCGSDTGECSMGVDRCVDGAIVCFGSTNPETEACNGLDDDCDGMNDESNPDGGRLCGESVGACVLGREVCTGGALVCTGGTDPVMELCNGLDDDCDGSIDEMNPEGGGACGNTTGACSAGTFTCLGGVLVCEGATGPALETCNAVDDDCDGMTDEGNPGGGSTCGTDVGACLPGTRQCVSGSLQCVGETMGSTESCNNIDDDCDGSIDEMNPGGGGACGIATGACMEGSEVCVGGTLVCQGGTGPASETCNMADDDCDGSTDEDFDFDNDLNNCGFCGNTCSFPNGIAQCVTGTCTLIGCETGFVNENGISGDGCEYMCDFLGAEICNGGDDDCDLAIDEGLTPPSNFCNPNGVCSTTSATCGGAAGWECNYPGTFETPEVSCDGLDNDCNGFTDDAFPLLGTSCTNGIGACQTSGVFVCTAAMDAVECNAPMAGMGSPEACNDSDDDCDGMIDENPGTLIPFVTVSGVDVMVYEASRPDATSADAGTTITHACSNANVLPWTNVTWAEASAACQALGGGWDLCDEADWEDACTGPSDSCDWSYASSCGASQPLVCNGEEYDSSGAAGDQDALFQTGRTAAPFNACYTNWGGGDRIYDLSGNVKEWTRTERGGSNFHAIRGGSYNNVEIGRRCDFDFTVGDNNFAFENTGFRCCRY